MTRDIRTGRVSHVFGSFFKEVKGIALKILADHRARIILKIIARAAGKQVLILQAAKQAGKTKKHPGEGR